jgi:hypothetical protein
MIPRKGIAVPIGSRLESSHVTMALSVRHCHKTIQGCSQLGLIRFEGV